jgi:hypothetical protein
MLKSYIVTLFILFSFNAYPNWTNLQPLCYQKASACGMASEVLNLPRFGNFQLRSRCRKKNQREIVRGVCGDRPNILLIQALLKLPRIGQYQWRNQCFKSIRSCEYAAEIWRELNHKNLAFLAVCDKFNRRFWNMPDQDMQKKGIFKCRGANYIELKVRAKRVR